MTNPTHEFIRALFENAEEIVTPRGSRSIAASKHTSQRFDLPQMPQLPQAHSLAKEPLPLEEDLSEERAAIMEIDGGLPRALAEFLAGKTKNNGSLLLDCVVV
ncbi:hypothetical protein [Aliiroseovarius sp. F20344]|uniref:hypothetical protein n=1 Tax=Aliiroseovarius sp. F20344 TaxID=2926414 RepID=UPI001FF582CA|nr:hypothetical protein [Aliiroseovarius sp. F20344]MCK0142996.1 hypothetical protein [Aliiroseovarius sp. F20344]